MQLMRCILSLNTKNEEETPEGSLLQEAKTQQKLKNLTLHRYLYFSVPEVNILTRNQNETTNADNKTMSLRLKTLHSLKGFG